MNLLLARLAEAKAQAIIVIRQHGLDADPEMVALVQALDLAVEHAGFTAEDYEAATGAFLLVQQMGGE